MMSRWAAAWVALAVFASGLAVAAPAVTGPASPPIPAKPATVAAAPAEPAEESHELTAEDAKTFFDGMIPYAIDHGNIAGSVLVIVKDGKILFAQGYGYADEAKHKSVIPDETLFRPGSVSKLFTWTAVMQQVQAGKLDLDRDVNDYLDFKIQEKFGKPITLRNLMTHTPGFEEGIHDAFVKNASDLYPLGDYLKKRMPARIYPPGEVTAYSNYGCSLAGYIVERVSGEKYADYIANHILKPLGMTHSTFEQPLPKQYEADMSKGYQQASDEKPVPFENIETAPAGALSATGTDMAHFMIAHLNNGSYNGVSILSPAVVALMHSPQSKMAPGVNGFDLGFYQENRNGLRIIGHAGDTDPFHSDLHLLLDKNVGVFMSFNSLGKEGESDKFRTTLFRAFLDRYFPYKAPEEATVADPKPDAARVAGFYGSSRKITSSLVLLFAIGQSEVAAKPDGTITIDVLKDGAGNPKVWREVGPLVYREVGGQTHTRFVTDANGNVSYWISDDFLPVLTFQRMSFLEQLNVMKVMMGVLVGSLVLTMVTWIGGWIVRRRFGKSLDMPEGAARLRLFSRLGAVALLLMFAGWAGLFSALSIGNEHIGTMLMALYVIGVLALVGAVAIVIEAASRVLRGPGGWLVRISELVLGVSALYAIWAIYAYGLANFNFTY
ncbi:MAG TPA: serine hydrolase [Rhizomicrobium sp.]|nr:serine hydrolase [Rhizomicrobium sp.]